MLDLTKSNLVLTAGRQIFFLIIGALILSFGLTSEWPKNNVNAMVQRKFPNTSTPNVFATALNTIANFAGLSYSTIISIAVLPFYIQYLGNWF